MKKGLLTAYFDVQDTLLCFEGHRICLWCFDKNSRVPSDLWCLCRGRWLRQSPPGNYMPGLKNWRTGKNFNCIEFGAYEPHSDRQPLISINNLSLLSTRTLSCWSTTWKQNKTKGFRNFFLTDNAKQASRLISISTTFWLGTPPTESLIEHVHINIHEGFSDNDLKVAVYTDHQVFERYHRFKLKETRHPQRRSIHDKGNSDAESGDYVTHIDHGIGRFAGLQNFI